MILKRFILQAILLQPLILCVTIAYHASQEQFAPSQLLKFVELAEQAGFTAIHSSDHFHPWSERQAQSARRRGRPADRAARQGGRAAHDRPQQRRTSIALPWDAEVSRVHATLERRGDGVDARSTTAAPRNGSFLDGERVRRRHAPGRRRRDRRRPARQVVFRSPGRRRDDADRGVGAWGRLPKVSEAQRRVLVALCRPYAAKAYAVPASNRQIADELVLGVETVKTHMRALLSVRARGPAAAPEARGARAARARDGPRLRAQPAILRRGSGRRGAGQARRACRCWGAAGVKEGTRPGA